MEDRLARLEEDAERLRAEAAALRAEYNQARDAERLRAENEALREAILRYAIAAAAVDVQSALLRVRYENQDDILENLRRSSDDEKAAAALLREIAKQLQAQARESSPRA